MPVIINIDMPKSCDDCPLYDDRWDYPTCYVTNKSRGYNWDYRNHRMSNCPLTEIKPTAKVDRCVCCGEIVPEGTMVCSNCIKKYS